MPSFGGVTNIGGAGNFAGFTSTGGKAGSGSGGSTLGRRQNQRRDRRPSGRRPTWRRRWRRPGAMPGGGRHRGEPLIDDFEDGNAGLPMKGGRAGGWYSTNDGSGQQMPPAGMPPNPLQNVFQTQVDPSKYALHTLGGGFRIWGADVGISFLSIPNRVQPCPTTSHRILVLRFSVRGNVSDDILRVSILTVETDTVEQGGTCVPVGAKMCDDHYSYLYGPIPNEWTVVSIPFTKLAQQQFGVTEPWNPQHALGIEFGVHAGQASSFDLWIDDVTFY